jgi:hypothetical protein
MSLAVNRLVLYVQGYGEKVRAENKISSAFENAYDTRIVVLRYIHATQHHQGSDTRRCSRKFP